MLWPTAPDSHDGRLERDAIEALGYEVKGMGAPLTEALKDPATEVLTF